MLAGVGDPAPHGGPIVLPVVDNRIMFVVAAVAGTLVTAFMVNFLKNKVSETEEISEKEDKDLELEFDMN